ncbi:MAG: hypothetical protein IPO58_12450 [Betaproteobacteria bacterium]|nr:hypothetical protein [Betaproteobacteria bacterium]
MMGMLAMIGMMLLASGGILFALNRRALLLTDRELIVRAGLRAQLPRSSPVLTTRHSRSLAGRAPRPRPALAHQMHRPAGIQGGLVPPLRSREKALVLPTDPFRVTYLPTSEACAADLDERAAALRESG